jgi:hypothetical protein
MFSERFTRKRPKSPNYPKSPASGYIFYQFLLLVLYIYVITMSWYACDIGFVKTLPNDITETKTVIIRGSRAIGI